MFNAEAAAKSIWEELGWHERERISSDTSLDALHEIVMERLAGHTWANVHAAIDALYEIAFDGTVDGDDFFDGDDDDDDTKADASTPSAVPDGERSSDGASPADGVLPGGSSGAAADHRVAGG